MRKVWVIVCVLALIGLVVAFAIGSLNPKAAGIEYVNERVTRGVIESVVVATGAVEPVNTVVVGSEISGQVSDLFVDFNDTVKAGQLIARIDPRVYETRHQQREADVVSAKATIASREAEIERAKANLKQAERELARRQELALKGHISQSEIDQDRNTFERETASLAIAEANLKNARAGLVQANAAVAASLLDLERTYIRSPIDGTVINRQVEVGQTVAASLQAPELFVIARDLHQMKVETSVDEADIGRLEEGMQCRFSVDAYVDRVYQGIVQQIRKAPNVVSSVVTYKVIVTAPNDDLSLLPGMTANVSIVLGKRDGALRIPNAALRFKPRDGSAVASASEPPTQESLALGQTTRGRPDAGRQADRLRDELGLNDQQYEQIEGIYRRLGEQMRKQIAQNGGPRRFGPDPRQIMRTMQSNAEKQLESILDDQQRLKFKQMRSGRTERKQAVVFVQSADGQLEQRNLIVGLQDDSFTEVLRGLEEGEAVVVRAHRSTAS